MNLLREKKFIGVIVNTFSQLINRLSGSGTTFIVTLIISYLLGISAFGSFIKIITFVTFFYLLIDFGINNIFLKHHYENAPSQLANLLVLRLSLASAAWIILVLTTLLLPYNETSHLGFSPLEKWGVLIFSLTVFTQAVELSLNSMYQKELLYRFTILPNLFSSVCLIVFVFFGVIQKNLLQVLIAYPVSEFLLCLTSFLILRNHLKLSFARYKTREFSKTLLKFSLPLAFMLFFNVIYFRVDTFILSFLKPNADVGIYGFSYKIFEVLITVPSFFANSVFPILIEKEPNKKEFRHHVKSYTLFLLGISLLSIPAVFLFSPLLSFIKPEFSESVTVLRILSFSLPFFFLTSLLQWVLILKNKQKILILIYLLSLILNIILNLVFIERFSYIASSYITVFSEGFVLACMGILFWYLKDEFF